MCGTCRAAVATFTLWGVTMQGGTASNSRVHACRVSPCDVWQAGVWCARGRVPFAAAPSWPGGCGPPGQASMCCGRECGCKCCLCSLHEQDVDTGTLRVRQRGTAGAGRGRSSTTWPNQPLLEVPRRAAWASMWGCGKRWGSYMRDAGRG